MSCAVESISLTNWGSVPLLNCATIDVYAADCFVVAHWITTFHFRTTISALKVELVSTVLIIVFSISSRCRINNRYLLWGQHCQQSSLVFILLLLPFLFKSILLPHPLQFSHHSHNLLSHLTEDLRLPSAPFLYSLSFPLWPQFPLLCENEVFHLLFSANSTPISLSPPHSHLFQDSHHISIYIPKILTDSFP